MAHDAEHNRAEPMPIGYEPTLSGSFAVHRITNPIPENGPMYRARIGGITLITDDVATSLQRRNFALDHPTAHDTLDKDVFVGISFRTPIEAHRQYMIKHLKAINESEGTYL